jgi:hypothetical protein
MPNGVTVNERLMRLKWNTDNRIRSAKICKSFEKKIPDFMADCLENEDLEAFLDHLEECESCRDELSIQYLVDTGMDRLEKGEAFHLQKDLNAFIYAEQERLGRRKRLTIAAYGLEVITVFAFSASIVLAMLLWV